MLLRTSIELLRHQRLLLAVAFVAQQIAACSIAYVWRQIRNYRSLMSTATRHVVICLLHLDLNAQVVGGSSVLSSATVVDKRR